MMTTLSFPFPLGVRRKNSESLCCSISVSSISIIILSFSLLLNVAAVGAVGEVNNDLVVNDNHAVSAARQPVLPQQDVDLNVADEAVKPKVTGEADKNNILKGGETAKHQMIEGAKEKQDVQSQNRIVTSGPEMEDKSNQANLGFMHAFIATLSVIVVSELGDKTFFIAAIMAMRHSRVTVFAGAMTALALMHVLSALFGTLATLIPRKLTFYLSSGLFAIFGVKMLREGWYMSPAEGQEEYEETQAELKKYEDDQLQARSTVTQDPETGIVRTADSRLKFLACVSPLFIQAATLNFLAEWGDRSQIAAIVLAARENLLGVILGGILGHFLCTGLAVIGGRAIAQKLSVRTVTIIGGVVFLLFAVSAFFVQT